MPIFDYVKYLGLYYGEEALEPLLAKWGFKKAPKLEKGDTATYLTSKELGVELCFDDERVVKIPGKEIPEGALVVSNIRFYVKGRAGYKPYQGALCPEITPSSTKPDVRRVLGMPNAPAYSSAGELLPGENDRIMRWDRADHCFFIAFTSEGEISNLGIQLPLDQA